MERVAGKDFDMNVFITGASGGLGRALANECGKRGYNLFLTDINAQGLKSIQLGLERQFGVTVTTAACDLTSDESVDQLLETIDAYGIRFDMLLNVAGLDFEGGFLERARRDIIRIISLNNEATLRITHAVLSRRRENHPFYLLFTSSLASMYPMPLKATYAASKRFLLDIAVALREELKDKQVNVLALCPGGLATTREAMSGIAAQGFWGGATTNPLEHVSRQTINRLLHRGGVLVPGALNRTLTFFGKLLPRRWVAAAIYHRWNKAQKAWSPVEFSAGR
ncbi:MAG: short-chain dehydrogenase [Firmicutes bacterium HGW-Firmicutes-9]|nr:MAG: short-chain dehydrogenase [Firmicutes bacterium HGW-Firmicutes-9]